MPVGRASIQVDDKQALRVTGGIATALDQVSLERFLQFQATDYLHERANSRFRAEGDAAVGGKWAALAPSTEETRARAGFGAKHPINRRTGELWDFVTNQPGRTYGYTDGAVLSMPGNGTQDEEDKLFTAQQGYDTDNSHVPARPVLALDGRDSSSLTRLLMEDFESNLERYVRSGTP